MFDSLKKKSAEAFGELKSAALKYKNKKHLVACVSGAYLMASADGVISPEERKKALAFISSNEILSVYKPDDVIAEFNGLAQTFDFDTDAGNAKALAAIGQLKGDEKEAAYLVRMIVAIAKSDGNFDASEQKVLQVICKELNLDPKQFA